MLMLFCEKCLSKISIDAYREFYISICSFIAHAEEFYLFSEDEKYNPITIHAIKTLENEGLILSSEVDRKLIAIKALGHKVHGNGTHSFCIEKEIN